MRYVISVYGERANIKENRLEYFNAVVPASVYYTRLGYIRFIKYLSANQLAAETSHERVGWIIEKYNTMRYKTRLREYRVENTPYDSLRVPTCSVII